MLVSAHAGEETLAAHVHLMYEHPSLTSLKAARGQHEDPRGLYIHHPPPPLIELGPTRHREDRHESSGANTFGQRDEKGVLVCHRWRPASPLTLPIGRERPLPLPVPVPECPSFRVFRLGAPFCLAASACGVGHEGSGCKG